MIEVIETVWIPMPDGVKLAARLWLPEGAREKPVPCILEYIPYRRRDRTRMRDEAAHPLFLADRVGNLAANLGKAAGRGGIHGIDPRDMPTERAARRRSHLTAICREIGCGDCG